MMGEDTKNEGGIEDNGETQLKIHKETYSLRNN